MDTSSLEPGADEPRFCFAAAAPTEHASVRKWDPPNADGKLVTSTDLPLLLKSSPLKHKLYTVKRTHTEFIISVSVSNSRKFNKVEDSSGGTHVHSTTFSLGVSEEPLPPSSHAARRPSVTESAVQPRHAGCCFRGLSPHTRGAARYSHLYELHATRDPRTPAKQSLQPHPACKPNSVSAGLTFFCSWVPQCILSLFY